MNRIKLIKFATVEKLNELREATETEVNHEATESGKEQGVFILSIQWKQYVGGSWAVWLDKLGETDYKGSGMAARGDCTSEVLTEIFCMF